MAKVDLLNIFGMYAYLINCFDIYDIDLIQINYSKFIAR